jgi:hypothetical protein
MVSHVEQKKRNPTLDTLLRMSEALDRDFESVFRRAKGMARKR